MPTDARLTSVASLLERGIDLTTILGAIVDELVSALQADRATLYLVDHARGELFSKVAHLPELKEIRLALGQGIAGTVAASGQGMNIADPYAHPLFNPAVDKSTGYRTRSMLVGAMRDSEGDVIGVFQALNKKTAAGFDASDESMLNTLAAQAADIIERTSLLRELKPRRQTAAPADYRYNFIVGSSVAMRQVYELVDKAARTSATVILQGESGTGKGLIARAIHLNSDRKLGPFVTIDCTALPPTLIESELFGHEKGAFTGADKQRPGKFELAQGGTIFIDEVGELPIDLQAKLLRVVQDGEFERIGGRDTQRVNFRLVAATHRNLDKMVADGTFRADLYYRIRVVPIVLPALRDRGSEDIKRLCEHFLDLFAKKHGLAAKRFSEKAMQRLLSHSWPGNIRELENCVESAMVLADGAIIEEAHLNLPMGIANPAGTNLHRTLAQVERDYVAAVLADCGGNQSECARRLGIGRNTLARKLEGKA